MVEPTNELILEILRRIQADIVDVQADLREIRERMGSFEIRSAHIELQIADLSVRMDRRDEQTERILRRLERTDQPH